LRIALWPELTQITCSAEAEDILQDPQQAVFIATSDGRPIGFVETAIKDWAPGCTTHPVGYIEGWYVEAGFRRQGVGRALIGAAENWARAHGCREMASDVELGNAASQAAHGRLGYEDARWGIAYHKTLLP